MTSRERIDRIFKGQEIDRPALKLWGYSPGMKLLHDDYKDVVTLAEKYTDVFSGWSAPFNLIYGADWNKYVTEDIKDTYDPLWYEIHTTVNTPAGKLHSVFRASRIGDPGFCTEYLLKSPEDVLTLLSIPYEPEPVNVDGYYEEERRIGDSGITIYHLPHAGYGLQSLCGSENFSYFYYDDNAIVHQFISTMASRLYDHTKMILDTGLKTYFGWVDPEVFIPPLTSTQIFEEVVFYYDKPLCDLLRNAGCYVWMHCHGKVRHLIDRFIEMGIDVINPLEPPKNGNIDMYELVDYYSGRIGLEGNIEIQDILMSPNDTLKLLIEDCVSAGRKSGRFTLCPSAGFNEYAIPGKRYIDNLKTYITHGYKCVNN